MTQTLTKDEVDALLQGIGSDGPPADAETAGADGPVRRYDMASDERIVRSRMPTLELVNERFARHIRSGLFEYVRKAAEVSVGSVRVHKFSSFLHEIVVPTNFNIVAVEPLRGNALVVCEPNLVFAVIDAIFGGAGKYPTRIEGREFSATEERVIQRLVETISAEYKKAWDGIYPIELAYRRSEMQPQFAQIASPGEMVVSTQFTLEIGETTGSIHFCFPYATLEPIRDTLYAAVQPDGSAPDKRWLELIQQELQSAEVEIVAELASAHTHIEQLLAFKPGDFVELDLNPSIQAKVSGVPVFDAHYGTSNNRYAIRIDRLLSSSDLSWLPKRAA
jgi:flagellar motor switch protein FliM